jgi:SM-20-related protein
MATASVFAACGFFIRRHFLDQDTCSRLMTEAAHAPGERGRLIRNGLDGILAEESRKVWSAQVSRATRSDVRQRLEALVPELERHFGERLAGCETPGFLIYDPGAFFASHTDAGHDAPAIASRRISAIVFLNQASGRSSDEGYRGGSLRFHGLLDGDAWRACPLPLEAESGMLVAFRADILHEVQPVTHGRRFSVVTWFHAPTS